MADQTATIPASKPVKAQKRREGQTRNSIAEWAVTILLLLFGTTTLVQAFVIPTGSMEDTLLIGDHLLVDKLAYAPAGTISKYVLPYEQPKHGDIIVFRYPVDITPNVRETGDWSTRRSSQDGEQSHLPQRRAAQ